MRKNSLTSALPALKPSNVKNLQDKNVSLQEVENKLNVLLNYVKNKTEEEFNTNKETILTACKQYTGISPAEFARQNGIQPNILDLPRKVKAQSRITRLINHKIISIASSYTLNPNPHKKEPSFDLSVNLGAVDKQYATLAYDGEQIILTMKVWDEEYILFFDVPHYVQQRDIIKISLPTIRYTNKGEYRFNFSTQEKPQTYSPTKLKAGVDLGRVKPYVIAVINPKRQRVAHYEASGKLTQLNLKRERIIRERQQILTKAAHYKKLGLDNTQLLIEATHKRNKTTNLGKTISQQTGSELVKKLAKHKIEVLHLEDLTWVTGSKYGSRWTHSKQQDSITHAANRAGIRTRKVNPKNTSRTCHQCRASITYSPKTRKVRCGDCQQDFDRDMNAALNIAKNKQARPELERNIGDDCSEETSQIIELMIHGSSVKDESYLLIRNTT